jgi:hypothetical protein
MAKKFPKEAGLKPNAWATLSGITKFVVPSDKEMNRDIGGNNRIGSPRYFYDSEIRRDGKH